MKIQNKTVKYYVISIKDYEVIKTEKDNPIAFVRYIFKNINNIMDIKYDKTKLEICYYKDKKQIGKSVLNFTELISNKYNKKDLIKNEFFPAIELEPPYFILPEEKYKKLSNEISLKLITKIKGLELQILNYFINNNLL